MDKDRFEKIKQLYKNNFGVEVRCDVSDDNIITSRVETTFSLDKNERLNELQSELAARVVKVLEEFVDEKNGSLF